MSTTEETEVIIVGAGPAGSTASMQLSNQKVPHIVLEKGVFPRDKICGDALSGKVVNIIKKVRPELEDEFRNGKKNLPSQGVIFVSPNRRSVSIPFKHNPEKHLPAGYISRRIDFDHFLAKQINTKYGKLIEDAHVDKISVTGNGVEVLTREGKTFRSQLLIDGSGVATLSKGFTGISKDNNHYSGGVRAYYKGVKELDPNGYIELHFLPEILPGYLWIFPLSNGEANVGMGMLTAHISKGKVNLRKKLHEVLQNDPILSQRFSDSEEIGKTEGWGLPLGSLRRQISSERILACGDAASLIDPFTGEGIANAMDSGRIAAEVAAEALKSGDLSLQKLREYDKRLYDRIWTELKLSYKLQRLVRFPFLFNFVTNKARKNKEFRMLLTSMFDNVNLRDEFRKPSFYFKLLFNRSRSN